MCIRDRRYTDQVEPFSIDESWRDVTGSGLLFGSGPEIADELRRVVEEETGLTISVGVSFNKTLAKLGLSLIHISCESLAQCSRPDRRAHS